MELILERGLPHQQNAIEAIAGVFENADVSKSVMLWQNKSFTLNDSKVAQNIKNVQQKFKPHNESRLDVSGSYLNLDVKMETGTVKLMCILKLFTSLITVTESINLLLPYQHCRLKQVLKIL